MREKWQKKRLPEDVPTPVAVALADFCRRADCPSSPAQVRDALAFLSSEEDFRVQLLAEGEPRYRPLGPFAAIDIVLGSSEPLASQRESCGYYDLLQEAIGPLPAPALTTASERVPKTKEPQPPEAPGAVEPPLTVEQQPTRPAALTVKERIAPKKRTAEARPAPLPTSHGRFAQLPARKDSFEELRSTSALERLAALAAGHSNRIALLRAASALYEGRLGALTAEELESAMVQQGLWPSFVEKEREQILQGHVEHRGASSRVAWALDCTPSELNRLIHLLGLSQNVKGLRERFASDALGETSLGRRLDLYGRRKYLADLGIQEQFNQALATDLRRLLFGSHRSLPPRERIFRVAREQGVPGDLLARVLEKLGLARQLETDFLEHPLPSN